jgi:nucleotide-binding universal stress UspA family protein
MTKDIKTILVPLDFSASSNSALDYAMMLAERFTAAIHLVHVCEVPTMMTMDAYAVASLDWNQKLGEAAERELETVAARLNDKKVSTEVLFGNPARCIVTAATTNQADLVVMGTHGHGAVMHLLMGNVAERVVRTAPCPVLTVREAAADKHQSQTPAKVA